MFSIDYPHKAVVFIERMFSELKAEAVAHLFTNEGERFNAMNDQFRDPENREFGAWYLERRHKRRMGEEV